IEECEVGVQPGTVGATIVLAHVEGIFEIIEVAHLQVAVDLVKLLHRHDRILDLGATDPLNADRELAGDDSLADYRQQWSSAAAQPRSAVSLDDDTHDVEASAGSGRRSSPRNASQMWPVAAHSERAQGGPSAQGWETHKDHRCRRQDLRSPWVRRNGL